MGAVESVGVTLRLAGTAEMPRSLEVSEQGGELRVLAMVGNSVVAYSQLDIRECCIRKAHDGQMILAVGRARFPLLSNEAVLLQQEYKVLL